MVGTAKVSPPLGNVAPCVFISNERAPQLCEQWPLVFCQPLPWLGHQRRSPYGRLPTLEYMRTQRMCNLARAGVRVFFRTAVLPYTTPSELKGPGRASCMAVVQPWCPCLG